MARSPRRRERPVAESRSSGPWLAWPELVVGAFLVYACFHGYDVALPLLGNARDIATATMVFEFMICLPAVFASGGTTEPSRQRRMLLCIGGAVAYVTATTLQIMTLGLPLLLIAQCLWLTGARLRPPPAVDWFSQAHCRVIKNVCGMAWAGLIILIALLFGIGGLAGHDDPSSGALVLPNWGYAVAWGGFYTIMAFVQPAARDLALREKAAPRERVTERQFASRRRKHRT